MNVGTKSLLFGVHQFAWHPITVLLSWRYLYGTPTWREAVCIFIHDFGYWGSPNMDGAEGTLHPFRGAAIAGYLFGPKYHDLVLGHSRFLAQKRDIPLSRLCWADKLSMDHEWRWWYLLRANLSGELAEYRANSEDRRFCPKSAGNRVWHRKLVELVRGDSIVAAALEAQANGRPGQLVFMGKAYDYIETAEHFGYYGGAVMLRSGSRYSRDIQVVYAPQLHRLEWRRPR